MNIYAHFADHVAAAIEALKQEGVLPGECGTDNISVEAPRDASHGDIATNAAMVLAKSAGMAPRTLAEKIAGHLAGLEDVAGVEVAGPGFINLRVADAFWPQVLKAVLALRGDFGRSDIGAGEPANVEYVSGNPTGPLHVGHARGGVFGDALASLLAYSGYAVTREYYINDGGAQVDVLARSAYLRYREALGEEIGEIPEGMYPGDYLKPVGRALAEEFGDSLLGKDESEWLAPVRKRAVDAMMKLIREDLAALNVHFDVFFSERSLIEGERDRVAETIAELKERGLVYTGRLPPPKGKLPDDWEDREQVLFRSTQFGDDVDRPLIKSDGSYTYFASDMAYHRDKFLRGFRTQIDVWGADHGGYVKRMKAAVKALTNGEAELDIKLCQMVRLFRGGEPVKMSKRAGSFITLRELVDEVGPDVARFIMLYRKNDAMLDFDFVKVTEQSRDNPVFYVQYAHARAWSVFRNTKQVFEDFDPESDILKESEFKLLTDEAELSLIKRIAQFPRLIESAAVAHEPHRLAFYLYELASDFHALWNRGKELPQLRFINEDDRDLTMARVALVAATAEILATGLGILGVQAIREMR
ncbi:MAG: arginine--tRNA ligase [Alphaproteobacteria bacterium]|nr:MAG: arginine--tRNA ligase [Alphaproteobacteria bacterium]